jgi:hypothetical protein
MYQTRRTPQSNTPTFGPLPGKLLDRARQRCLDVDQGRAVRGHDDPDHAVKAV